MVRCPRNPHTLSRTVRDLQSAQSIVFNGQVYKSLAQHDPARTQRISEYNKLYNLDAAWHICSPSATPDALHVCAAYPSPVPLGYLRPRLLRRQRARHGAQPAVVVFFLDSRCAPARSDMT